VKIFEDQSKAIALPRSRTQGERIESVGRMRSVLNWAGWIALGAALVALAILSLT
jgi:hypothetical protein